MDRHVFTVRRRIGGALRRRLLATWLLASVAAACAVVAVERPELTPSYALDRLPLAVLAGQAVACAWLVLGLVGNPLSYRYLRTRVRTAPTFIAGAVPGEPHPVGVELLEAGLVPRITAHDGNNPAFVVDIYQSRESLLTAVVSRDNGTVSLLTRLGDGRIAHTAAMQVLPHEAVVANVVPGADLADLLAAHRSLAATLALYDVGPVPSGPRVWLDAIDLEHRSWTDLGAFHGAFLDLGATRAWGRLLVRIDPAAVLELAVPARHDVAVAESGSSELARAFGAASPAPTPA